MKNLASLLLTWYKSKNYTFPWRNQEKNPYKIWISEIMLQQTQVNTVQKYFDNWIKIYPTINDVAKSSNDKILFALVALTGINVVADTVS